MMIDLHDRTDMEVELKLRGSAELLDTLSTSDSLRALARDEPSVRALENTYFDTGDYRLARRGISLRLRAVEGRCVQTLKSPRLESSTSHARAEWEVDRGDAGLDLRAFDDPQASELVGALVPGELQPAFRTAFTRRSLVVDWPDGKGGHVPIDLAFDRGTIEAGDRREDLAEIELELLEGEDGVALFELAHLLRRVGPLALETRNKAERGFALAELMRPRGVKAGKLELPADCILDRGIDAVLRYGLGHWMRNEPAVLADSDPLAVHQMRVALRRLRSALSLFREVLPEQARAHWNTEMRWLLASLGSVRDLDVFEGETLARVELDGRAGRGRERLAQLARERRREARRALDEALASTRYADLLFEFARWVERKGWRDELAIENVLAQQEPLERWARHMLARRFAKLAKRGRRFKELGAEERHEVRIAVKKLRYGVEFFQDVLPEQRDGALGKQLSEMQKLLGQRNDAAVAETLMHDLLEDAPHDARRQEAAWGAGAVMGWMAHDTHDLECRTRKCWKALMRRAPPSRPPAAAGR